MVCTENFSDPAYGVSRESLVFERVAKFERSKVAEEKTYTSLPHTLYADPGKQGALVCFLHTSFTFLGFPGAGEWTIVPKSASCLVASGVDFDS